MFDNLKDAYQVGFSVVTTKEVQESNRSCHTVPYTTKKETVEVGKEFSLVKNKSVDSEKSKDNQESTLKWNFNKKPLYPNSDCFELQDEEHENDVVHHLKLKNNLDIFENSGDFSM